MLISYYSCPPPPALPSPEGTRPRVLGSRRVRRPAGSGVGLRRHEGKCPEPQGPWGPSGKPQEARGIFPPRPRIGASGGSPRPLKNSPLAPGALCALEPRGLLRGRGVLGAPGAPRPVGPMPLAQGSLKPSRGPWGSRGASRADPSTGVPMQPGSWVAFSITPPEGPSTPGALPGREG